MPEGPDSLAQAFMPGEDILPDYMPDPDEPILPEFPDDFARSDMPPMPEDIPWDADTDALYDEWAYQSSRDEEQDEK